MPQTSNLCVSNLAIRLFILAQPMDTPHVQFAKEGFVALISLNEPKTLNALSESLLEELKQNFEAFLLDDTLRVAIITGTGRSFVAGADIVSMSSMNAAQAARFSQTGAAIFRAIEQSPKPVIAAVNGFALGGGCELALACDIRLAAETAKFGQPEVGLGILPGFSGTQRLARIVGQGKAKELIFTGKVIKAQEALSIGLVNAVTTPENLLPEALAMANAISLNAPVAVQLSKKAINEGYDLPIEEAIELETRLFAQCFETEDQKQGMAAFIRKEKATFQGK